MNGINDLFSRFVSQYRLATVIYRNLRHKPNSQKTIGDLIEERADKNSDDTFLFFEDRKFTFSEFNTRANRVAHWAKNEGLGKGSVVALLMGNRPEFIFTWAGLSKLGIITSFINTGIKTRGLEYVFETAGATHLILGSECLETFNTVDKNIVSGMKISVWLDTINSSPEIPEGVVIFDNVLQDMPDTNPDRDIRNNLVAGDDMLYIFTSGTTGYPKATHMSHMRFFASGDAMAGVAKYRTGDVLYDALPLYHGAGGVVVPSCALNTGCAMTLTRKFSASRFWDDCRKYDITGFQYVGEFCRYLLNQPEKPNDRDHKVRIIIGAGLRPELWERFQNRFGIKRIVEIFGSTEGNTALANLDNKAGSIGRIPFYKLHNGDLVRFDTATGEHVREGNGFCIRCKPGEVGEFIGKLRQEKGGIGKFEGYTSEEETQKKIIRDVFEKGDAWFRTGDLLRRDEDDYFYFIDRIGDTFRWKSENVSTQEVAEQISGFPGIDFINVYGVEVPGEEGRAGMAAIVLSDGTGFDAREFYQYTEEHLPSYAAPVFIRIRMEADMTGTFKLRKVNLREEGYDPDMVSDPLFIRSKKEKTYLPLTKERMPIGSQVSE